MFLSVLLSLFVTVNLAFGGNDTTQSPAYGCTYVKTPFVTVKSDPEDCEEICWATPGCTHFSHSQDKCQMRDGKVSKETHAQGSDCGVLKFDWDSKEWAVGCEFDHKDSIFMTIGTRASDCAKMCHDYKDKCLHYSWSWNGATSVCHLQSGVNTQAILVNSDCNICGIRPKIANESTFPWDEFEASDWSPMGWRKGCQFQNNNLSKKFSPSLVDCKNSCLGTDKCSNYNWNSKTSLCELMSGLVHKKDALESAGLGSFCGLVPVIWHGKLWARSCTFRSKDLNSVSDLDKHSCERQCKDIPQCTHYVWTSMNKTCHWKSGVVTKDDAYYNHEALSRCGICDNCKDVSSEIIAEGHAVILSVALLLFLTVLVGTIYLYQLKKLSIRYQLTKFSMRRHSITPNSEFIFDAFVSYSSVDSDWVVNELMGHLEGGNNDSFNQNCYKVCVHERDFKVGRSIAENIITSLEQSITCLLILTKHFTNSYWCNFEAHAANQIFQEQSRINYLIVVIFDGYVPSNNLNSTLKYLVKNHTYLEWKSDDAQEQEIFWTRLRETLREASLRSINPSIALTLTGKDIN